RWRFEVRRDDLPRLIAWHDRNDFKGYAGAPPLQDPFLEETHVVAAHELEAAAEVGLHPTVDGFQTVRQGTPPIPDTLGDRHHVIVAKSFDDHEQHVSRFFSKSDHAPWPEWRAE